MLKVENLTFSYKRKGGFVFNDFTMSFEPGHIYGLLGLNGTGKSTLLALMAGLLTPQEGAVTLDGTDVRRRLPLTLRETFIVPDEFELPDVRLSEYIHDNALFYPRFSQDDMKTYLDVFGMEGDPQLSALSLGQRKKIYMSFAMATHTHMLLMDEPTNGLDIPGKEQFRRFLMAGRRDDSIFIVSTHQVKDIEQTLDHITVIGYNEVIADTDAEPLRTDGRLDLERYFNSLTEKGGES